MNFWKLSKLQAIRILVTTIGVSLIALLATVMYWQTTQAAALGGGADYQKATGSQIERKPVKLSETTTPTTTATPDDHGGGGNGGGGGDDGGHHGGGGNDDGQHDRGIRGHIDSLPEDGLLGTWVISGTHYVVTTTTQLEQHFGVFAVDACVQVKSDASTTPATALRIETKQDFVCTATDDGGDDNGHHGGDHSGDRGRLFGVIQSMPISLTGTLTSTWRIGGLDFVTDSSTEFNQEHGAFAISVTVEVKFYVDADDVNHATKITSKFVNNHHGHDGDGNGSHEGAEGHAFGTLDSFPSDLIGVWLIGGIEYSATNHTKFQPEHGAFAQGVLIKVEYFLDANNHRIAREIETTTNNGGADTHHFVLVGFVQALPDAGFTGIWEIGNITFTANLSTTFKEEHGSLAVGAFVVVKYSVTDGVRVIQEIETHIPPGAGEHNHVGKIEDVGDDGLAAASVSANSVWRIAGQDYAVTTSTTLNDMAGALAVNQTAIVNSYTAADGSEVATEIQGVTANAQVFLPMVRR